MMTHLSLFSGIGGLDLAAEMAGFRTVGQCEWADYPHAVLERHWPDVPKWRDIRTLTGESFHERTGLRTVDIISGGFPCQPFSLAGKRRGMSEPGFWLPEPLEIPRVRENVKGRINRLKCLGNAVVPQQFYPMFRYIREIEEGLWSAM